MDYYNIEIWYNENTGMELVLAFYGIGIPITFK